MNESGGSASPEPHTSLPNGDGDGSSGEFRPELGAAIAVFVAGFVGTVIGVGFASISFGDGFGPVAVGFLGQWAGAGAATLAFFRVGRFRRPMQNPFADRGAFRFRWVDPAFAAAGVILQFVVLLPYVLLQVDREKLEAPANDLADRAGTIGIGFAALCLITIVGAPLAEEGLFRWLIHGTLRLRFRVGWAVLISSIWFGAAHFQPLQFLALALFGAAAALVRERTQRFWPSVFLHGGFNAITMLILGLRLARNG